MANVKTAISLEKSLFQEINTLANEMEVSRSRLFVIAIEQFIRDYKKQKMLDALNTVYANGIDSEDRIVLDHMKRRQRKLLEKPGNEW